MNTNGITGPTAASPFLSSIFERIKPFPMKNYFIFLAVFGFFTGHSQGAESRDSTVQQDSAFALHAILLEDDPLLAQLDSLLHHSFFGASGMNTLGSETFVGTYPDSLNTAMPNWPDSVYAERLAKLNQQTPLSLEFNSTVRAFIALYAEKRREQVSRILGLAQFYFPLFEAKLDQYNMPLELKYLAVVESALNPRARSRVGATGLWQFMYSTGRLQGLEVTSYVDERSDPLAATDAACRYLKKLYALFGDWNLALAAYNSGPGNVSKAIRRSGGQRDYWRIRPYLPRETGGYVPAFIAVNYIMNYAEEHMLYPTEVKGSYWQTDTVMIRKKVSFAQLSTLLDLSEEDLAFLNPSYRYGIIPEREEPYPLVLPLNKTGLFVSFEDSIYQLAARDFAENGKEEVLVAENEPIYHRVQRGEVLGKIAERYGVRVSHIRQWNGLRGNTIRIGQRLRIYPRGSYQKAASQPIASGEQAKPAGNGTLSYRVRSGETFYSIARKYPGISAENIMEWNNYSNARSLKPGARLKIYPNKG